ncbi:unnamed protein product [Owenia fusiformis]|uniref:Apple domain-containing protein n=1 Tax=Owenia fusiformis TaxID=6347 RepID=A0A8S4NRE9_OWEFU|nr:unnamed protein product [Owenia fusiformis]
MESKIMFVGIFLYLATFCILSTKQDLTLNTYDRTYAFGAGLRGELTTLTDCINFCKNSQLCYGADWNRDYNECWIHERPINPNDIVEGLDACCTQFRKTCNTCPTTGETLVNHRIIGGTSQGTGTAAQCAAVCDADPACVASTLSDTGECFTHTGPLDFTTYPYDDSGDAVGYTTYRKLTCDDGLPTETVASCPDGWLEETVGTTSRCLKAFRYPINANAYYKRREEAAWFCLDSDPARGGGPLGRLANIMNLAIDGLFFVQSMQANGMDPTLDRLWLGPTDELTDGEWCGTDGLDASANLPANTGTANSPDYSILAPVLSVEVSGNVNGDPSLVGYICELPLA